MLSKKEAPTTGPNGQPKGSQYRDPHGGGGKPAVAPKKFWSQNISSMQLEACMRAQAKLPEPSASPWAHIKESQNVTMMLAEAGSYAQAWHNVLTTINCAFNMWL
jgi:hypothetical protein